MVVLFNPPPEEPIQIERSKLSGIKLPEIILNILAKIIENRLNVKIAKYKCAKSISSN